MHGFKTVIVSEYRADEHADCGTYLYVLSKGAIEKQSRANFYVAETAEMNHAASGYTRDITLNLLNG